MRVTPHELYQRARALADERRFEAARDALEQAEAQATDPDLSARIAGTLGYVLGELGEPARGERICRAALDRVDISLHSRGVLAGQLGSILVAQGSLDEGLDWLGRAIDTIPDDPLAVANLRMNRAVLCMQRREFADAAADLEAAIAVYREHGSAVDVAEAQHNLGYVAMLAGDLVRAMSEMSAARPAIAEVSPANAAIADVDRAEVLRDSGLLTEAERLLEAAAATFGAHRMPRPRGEAELHLAYSQLRHDAAAAARTAGVAARRLAGAGASSWAARAEGIRWRARLAQLPRRIDDTEIDRVARTLHRAGLRTEAVSLRLGRELWRARSGRPAGRIPALPAGAGIDARVLVHDIRAVRHQQAGRSASARRDAAAGLDELATWRNSFGSLELQASLAMYANGLMLTGLGSAIDSGRPDVVFEWAERARHLSLQVTPVRPPRDPEAAADLAALRSLRADLQSADWMADPRAVVIADRLRARQWTTGAGEVTARVDLAGFQPRLGDDMAALIYVFSPRGLACLRVTRDRADVIDLGDPSALHADLAGLRSDLDVAASVRVGPMAAVVQRSLQARLERLSAALLAPVVDRISVPRLVLTVPGILSGIPWAMLPHMRGRAFTIAGSLSRWSGWQDRPRVAATRGRDGLGVGVAVGPRVARGLDEAERAAQAWRSSDAGGAVMLSDAAATVEGVSDLAQRAPVLHVIAHGRHSVDNPLFSGVELSDGVLFGYDVDALPAVSADVILSACEVGRSAVRWGEEALGMTRAWMHAGARSIIAAPVVVADDDACELLGAVHVGLAAGIAPAQALADAVEHTGILAPFQCHGNGF